MDNDVVCCFKNYPNITFVDIYNYHSEKVRYKFIPCVDCSNLNNFLKIKCVDCNLQNEFIFDINYHALHENHYLGV